MKIPRNRIEEINLVPAMAGRKSHIAFVVAKEYIIFGVVLGGASYILHDMGLSWRLGLALGFLFGWLYSAVRELRWCVERIYFAVGNSVEDTAEDNAGFPWARARRIR